MTWFRLSGFLVFFCLEAISKLYNLLLPLHLWSTLFSPFRAETKFIWLFVCLKVNENIAAWSDGQGVRTSTSEAVDSDSIPSRVKPMSLENLYSHFPAWRWALKDSAEKKPANLLAVFLQKAFSGIPLA